MSLLTQAKQHRDHKRDVPLTEEQFELVYAWLAGDIGASQMMRVLQVSSSGAYAFIARGVRQLYQRGELRRTRGRHDKH